MSEEAARKVRALACWRGPVEPQPLGGGISNHNFLVDHDGARYFVRIGEDFLVHNVLRRFATGPVGDRWPARDNVDKFGLSTVNTVSAS